MDSLGFVSDKFSIELRSEDIRFPTILPETGSHTKDTFLHLASHQTFDGRPDAAQIVFPEFQTTKAQHGGKLWIEAGPDMPDEMQAVEGPLVPTSDGRCKAELIVDGKCRVGTSARLL